MRTVALVNPLSGGVGADGVARMTEQLERAGIKNADVISLEPGDLDRQIAEHVKAAPDFMAVWGGDGTLRSALAQSGLEFKGLIPLPGGTMNLLLKWIYGERSWEEILSATIANPRDRLIPGGRVRDHTFYCAMLAGAPAPMAEARESLRRGDVMDIVKKSGAALDALNNMHLHARYHDGYNFGDGDMPTTSVLGAMVGPLAGNNGMEVAALADASAASALEMLWSSFTSDWRQSSSLRLAPASDLIIEREDDDHTIPVILDGEKMEFDGLIHVTYVQEAARCLIPA
jgi:diacylglycerol kinase family enzyme